MSHCTSCGAEIVWARHTRTFKPAPIDPGTDLGKVLGVDGNVLLYPSAHPMYTVGEPFDLAVGDEAIVTTSHFATCPSAEAHR